MSVFQGTNISSSITEKKKKSWKYCGFQLNHATQSRYHNWAWIWMNIMQNMAWVEIKIILTQNYSGNSVENQVAFADAKGRLWSHCLFHLYVTVKLQLNPEGMRFLPAGIWCVGRQNWLCWLSFCAVVVLATASIMSFVEKSNLIILFTKNEQGRCEMICSVSNIKGICFAPEIVPVYKFNQRVKIDEQDMKSIITVLTVKKNLIWTIILLFVKNSSSLWAIVFVSCSMLGNKLLV